MIIVNVYDTVNRLASEIKTSEEYVNFKMAKEALKMKPDLAKRIKEFEELRYKTQLVVLQEGKMMKKKLKRCNNYIWS